MLVLHFLGQKVLIRTLHPSCPTMIQHHRTRISCAPRFASHLEPLRSTAPHPCQSLEASNALFLVRLLPATCYVRRPASAHSQQSATSPPVPDLLCASPPVVPRAFSLRAPSPPDISRCSGCMALVGGRRGGVRARDPRSELRAPSAGPSAHPLIGDRGTLYAVARNLPSMG